MSALREDELQFLVQKFIKVTTVSGITMEGELLRFDDNMVVITGPFGEGETRLERGNCIAYREFCRGEKRRQSAPAAKAA